jgi:hypothetical protein
VYALTIWQPCTDAIAFGDKDVENRSWPAPPWIIGEEIGFHAGRTLGLATAPPCGCSWPEASLPGGQRVRGAVIATVVVAGCHHERQCRSGPCSPWIAARQWHWDLADRRPLAAPVPARGFRQLWQLLPAAVEAITADQSRASGQG